MRARKPSPTTIIAVVALFVALGGTAVAASRYIITSTSQIEPSVLKALRREAEASAASVKPAAKGGHIIRAVAQSTKPFDASRTTSPRPAKGAHLRVDATEVPLSDASWTQYPEEVNQLFGEMTVTRPSEAECPGRDRPFYVSLYVNGESVGEEEFKNGPSQTEETDVLGWVQGTANGTDMWLFPSSEAKEDTITVEPVESCPKGHFTIDSITVDVEGVR